MRLGGRFGRGGMGRGGSSKPGGILFFFCSFSFSVTVSGVFAAGRALGSRWRVFDHGSRCSDRGTVRWVRGYARGDDFFGRGDGVAKRWH